VIHPHSLQEKDMTEQALATRAEQTTTRPAVTPRVDVIEDTTGITVTADLPGVRKDDLVIRVDGDTLTIEADVAPADTARNLKAVYTEVRARRYRRSFTLSRELDSANIAASLKDGVLNLRVPKLEKALPRRIDVQTA
jgi:HSP20 family molecular chaperone IbpA